MHYYLFEIEPKAIIKAPSAEKAIDCYILHYPEASEIKICQSISEHKAKAMILDILLDKLEVAIFHDTLDEFINKDVLFMQQDLYSNETKLMLSNVDMKRIE